MNLQYGNKWTKISSFFENRTERKVKHQFFSLIRKSLRTICRVKGIKNATYFLNKIKTQSLSTLITKDLEINFDDLKNFGDFKIKEYNYFLNLFDYIKKFAFVKFSDIKNSIGIKDIFIASKCIGYLIKIDSDRSKLIYQNQRIFNANVKMLGLDKISDFENMNVKEKKILDLKCRLVSDITKFKEFTNNFNQILENDFITFRKKDYEIENLYKINIQEKIRNVFRSENLLNK